MTKQTVKNALEKIGVTDEQKQAEFFSAFAEKKPGQISENDVAAALDKLGVTDKKTLGDFFAAVREPEIMDRELDLDELDAVAGGNACHDDDADRQHCVQQRYRVLSLWDPEKRTWEKNCAATVETIVPPPCSSLDIDSTCSLNDGCEYNAVIYALDNDHIRLLDS